MPHKFSVIVLFCAVFAVASADFRTDGLNVHNRYRAMHHAPPLALCDELNQFAQNYAQKMADSNKFAHSNGKYGENIYMTTNTKLSDSEAVTQATNLWYNEMPLYNFKIGKFTSSAGHFTQVVWVGSKNLGIGVGRSSKGVYVCANYNPPGNMQSKFLENVLEQ